MLFALVLQNHSTPPIKAPAPLMKKKTNPKRLQSPISIETTATQSKSISRSKSSKSKASTQPTWIGLNIFTEAKVVAWEGHSKTLAVQSLYPSTTTLAHSLSLGKKAGWPQIIHPLDRLRVITHFKSLKKQILPSYIDYRIINTTGSIHWIRHSIISVDNESIARGFIHDVQTEKEYQLESLRVCDREQNRIGQDLHDDLCQVLAGVSCLMRVAESRIGSKLPEEVSYLTEINQQIIDAMHRTRALTHGLFPGKIQIADIRGALLELAEQIRARFKVEISTRFISRFPEHSSAQIIQIYRITQEAISNAIKHGNSTHIDVTLTATKNDMVLTVHDNGTGLGKSDNITSGVGLHIMSYRAGILGGTLGITNAKPRGVVATLRYPFQR